MKTLHLLLFLCLLPLALAAQENKIDAVVALPKLNVLYFGVPNPVQIAVPGVTSDKLTATVTNGSINKTSTGWEIKPSLATGVVKLTVLVDNKKVSEKSFRVKSIPWPVATISGKQNGAVSKNEIITAGELDTEIKDFLWDLRFEVTSYSFVYTENGSDKEISVSGNKLTNEIKSAISNLKSGQQIIFKEIKALSPDNRIQDINPLTLTVN
jgi:hypothetical protein